MALEFELGGTVMRRPLTKADVGLATSEPSLKYETPNSTPIRR